MLNFRRVLGLLLLSFIAAPAGLAADVRVGDPGAKADPTKFDPTYPDMKEWAEAGVRGGIPARASLKTLKTLKPGDDIQAAIDAAAKAGGGVVLLSTGTYSVRKCIQLRTNVVLRGENREMVILENSMRSPRLTHEFFTVRVAGAKHSGLEDLTLRHDEVARRGLKVYAERVAGPKNNPAGVTDLHVAGVGIEDAEDCWLDNVNILHSGSHPLEVAGLRITLRDVLVDGAFNKGEEGAPAGEGNVYFSVTHGLMYHCTVSNVRHCLVMRDTLTGGDCKFNVILDCDFTGDVNFHGDRKDSGHNLFEGVLVRSLLSHGWPAWSYWRREEIGLDNIVYKCAGWGGKGDKFTSNDPKKVYTFVGMRDPNLLTVVDKPEPKSGTLYATTAARPGKLDAGDAFPTNATQSRDLMFKRMIASPLAVSAGGAPTK